PNRFETAFPEADASAPYTYLMMDGGMAESMRAVDAYRAAIGEQPGAEAFEHQPVLGFLLRQVSGHDKAGVLNEKSARRTSALTYASLWCRGDRRVAALPPDPGFDFPIDCVDNLGFAVLANPRPDHTEVRGPDGERLRAERVIPRDDGGEPVAWSARF